MSLATSVLFDQLVTTVPKSCLGGDSSQDIRSLKIDVLVHDSLGVQKPYLGSSKTKHWPEIMPTDKAISWPGSCHLDTVINTYMATSLAQGRCDVQGIETSPIPSDRYCIRYSGSTFNSLMTYVMQENIPGYQKGLMEERLKNKGKESETALERVDFVVYIFWK